MKRKNRNCSSRVWPEIVGQRNGSKPSSRIKQLSVQGVTKEKFLNLSRRARRHPYQQARYNGWRPGPWNSATSGKLSTTIHTCRTEVTWKRRRPITSIKSRRDFEGFACQNQHPRKE
eukprot:scaffold2970_cov90-Cylindrotheca_fusiformis.AAC.1